MQSCASEVVRDNDVTSGLINNLPVREKRPNSHSTINAKFKEKETPRLAVHNRDYSDLKTFLPVALTIRVTK